MLNFLDRLSTPSPSAVLAVSTVFPPPVTFRVAELYVDETISKIPSLVTLPDVSFVVDKNKGLSIDVFALIVTISPIL